LAAERGVAFSLPPAPVLLMRSPLVTDDDFDEHDHATVRRTIRDSLDPRR
jgi:hypothetical protein